MKKIGLFSITYEMLEKLLNLDDDHKVLDVGADWRYNREADRISIKVSGPLMPEIYEGGVIPRVPAEWLEMEKERLKEAE
jgi:hypothetical protein